MEKAKAKDQTAKRNKRTPKHLKEFYDAERHSNRSGQLPKSFCPIFGGHLIKKQVRRKKETGQSHYPCLSDCLLRYGSRMKTAEDSQEEPAEAEEKAAEAFKADAAEESEGVLKAEEAIDKEATKGVGEDSPGKPSVPKKMSEAMTKQESNQQRRVKSSRISLIRAGIETNPGPVGGMKRGGKRKTVSKEFEEAREMIRLFFERRNAAVMIQRRFRAFLQRREFLRLRRMQRQREERQRKAAIVIQSQWRMITARIRFLEMVIQEGRKEPEARENLSLIHISEPTRPN